MEAIIAHVREVRLSQIVFVLTAMVVVSIALHFRTPVEFCIFGCTLVGVAVFHGRNTEIAIGGLLLTAVYKGLFLEMDLWDHVWHEARTVGNLFGLLLAFAILAKCFERSRVPDILPRYLADDWRGAFGLLATVAGLSMFLDNIAAALIGAVVAKKVFDDRVTVGYLAAIVAASNAGGAPSVIGDTTTTMMWIEGVQPLVLLKASIASGVAVVLSGIIAARQQDVFQRIRKDPPEGIAIEWRLLGAVVLIVFGAIVGNVVFGLPAAGAWLAILMLAIAFQMPWGEIPGAAKGALFLCSLVLMASMMPVETLPSPSWTTALGLGFVSAVFDNIPLTALALEQGGYDWGVLAFAVGYGGSMIWFGSSAGVAVAGLFPEAKNTGRWLREGWHVALAYVAGFAAMILLGGWNP